VEVIGVAIVAVAAVFVLLIAVVVPYEAVFADSAFAIAFHHVVNAAIVFVVAVVAVSPDAFLLVSLAWLLLLSLLLLL